MGATHIEGDVLDGLEVLLVQISGLVGRLDRELRVSEERVDVGRMRAPVADRLHESVTSAAGIVPSPVAPHVASASLRARVLSAIDRVTTVTYDTAPNRATARVLDLAILEVSHALRRGEGEHRARLVRARSVLIGLRRNPALSGLSPLRPSDLMHRSLRMAPKYRAVLQLHGLLVGREAWAAR